MRAERKVVVCWGELVIDLLPGGACVGGTAANVARHAAALGLEARLVSAVGCDAAGDAALEALSRFGVAVSGVVRLAQATTATTQVSVEAGELRYRAASELPWASIDFSAPLEAALAGADALVFALFAQKTRLDLELLARQQGPALRVADFNLRADVPRAVLERAARIAHVIQLAAGAAERAARALASEDAARTLLESHPVELVAVTDGACGARIVTAEGEVRGAPARVAPTADSVGAGDAFAAGLTCALLKRASPAAALARAGEAALGQIEGSVPVLRVEF